eukprot:gnl/MRDRNA2_/MRDRNA2_124091_c0_seq1.p1 gnl/MRDRNA2_/MRDRNA2_124091_c0~~gnl/MRDRNA2_/MRDRNA2_124091_c0_seq1.p1  ORF type:complete len:358 (+),score=55.97 gnl/MRDRNA2_/MRDRNA2_124091_c0_seq1:83-1156(+)
MTGIKLSFLRMNGEAPIPEQTFDVSATVSDVRILVSASLGIPARQVVLLFGLKRLHDAEFLDKALCGLSEAEINVVCSPDYCKYITQYFQRDIPKHRCGRASLNSVALQAFARLGIVDFPPPTGININMMPFTIGQLSSIPREYQQYWNILTRCHGTFQSTEEYGQVGYLTIQESFTPAGESQRRGGLHIEAPGAVMSSGGRGEIEIDSWGLGRMEELHNLIGGIYMASSVAKSTKVWNCQVRHPKEIVGELGDIEHLREFLDDEILLGAGELIWLTDTTPHESLPLEEGTYRQFFRFVTSELSAWYEKHSTKNPLGVVPDPRRTQTIPGDKFATGSCMHCKPTWVGWWCSYCGQRH